MSKDVARDVIMSGLSGLGIGHFRDVVTSLTEESGAQKLKNVQFNTNLKKKRRRMCSNAH